MIKHALQHENLDCYRFAVEASRWFRRTKFPRGDWDLRNQAKRAADSVVLNLAEGQQRAGKDRKQHYRIAAGSAAEACAVLDCLDIEGGEAVQAKLRLIVAMVRRLPA